MEKGLRNREAVKKEKKAREREAKGIGWGRKRRKK